MNIAGRDPLLIANFHRRTFIAPRAVIALKVLTLEAPTNVTHFVMNEVGGASVKQRDLQIDILFCQ